MSHFHFPFVSLLFLPSHFSLLHLLFLLPHFMLSISHPILTSLPFRTPLFFSFSRLSLSHLLFLLLTPPSPTFHASNLVSHFHFPFLSPLFLYSRFSFSHLLFLLPLFMLSISRSTFASCSFLLVPLLSSLPFPLTVPSSTTFPVFSLLSHSFPSSLLPCSFLLPFLSLSHLLSLALPCFPLQTLTFSPSFPVQQRRLASCRSMRSSSPSQAGPCSLVGKSHYRSLCQHNSRPTLGSRLPTWQMSVLKEILHVMT